MPGEIAQIPEFYEDLGVFNQTGEIFKDFIGNKDNEILEPILSINDINQGSIFNSLFSHIYHTKLATKSIILTEAESIYLDKIGEIFKIPRPTNFNDQAYVGFILGRLLSSIASLPQIARLFDSIVGAKVFQAKEMGFFSDFSCSDAGVIDPFLTNSRLASSITCFQSNAVYVYVPDLLLITPDLIAQLAYLQASGTAIYIGEY